MDLGLGGKSALVAASSTGLGRAVAVALGREGARVTLGARSEENLRAAAREVEEAGGESNPVRCDLTDAASIRALLGAAEKRFGGVDVLVTNSGGPPPGQLADLSEDQWETAVESLLFSVIRLARGVLPHMKEKGWGRIISLVSVSAKQPIENLLLSNTIRPAVVGFAKSLSQEVAPHGITVNCVAPGYTRTGRLDELAAARAERTGAAVEEVFRGWESTIPVGRLGRPEELADLVLFLASERAAYLTGLTVTFDGGSVRGLL
ncbi:MAG: SDR family oxidoreductase [Candidatus Eisenbacteria bacterium]